MREYHRCPSHLGPRIPLITAILSHSLGSVYIVHPIGPGFSILDFPALEDIDYKRESLQPFSLFPPFTLRAHAKGAPMSRERQQDAAVAALLEHADVGLSNDVYLSSR